MEIIIKGLIILAVSWFVIQRFIPAKGVRQIKTNDLKKMIKDKRYQFIDVRTPYEYKTDHIKGFKNIPLAEFKQRCHELSKDKEVVVICQSGNRSNRAAKILKKLKFPNVTNVKGGMTTWKR